MKENKFYLFFFFLNQGLNWLFLKPVGYIKD